MPFTLTFDDGPGPSMPALLDVLRDAQVGAMFFMTGCNIEEPAWDRAAHARAMTVRALAEGHELGNHSMSHARAWTTADDGAAFMREVPRMDALIRALR